MYFLYLLDLGIICLLSACAGIIADKNCEEVILEPRTIAVRYLKTWFLVDLLSSLPFDYIIIIFTPEPNVAQFVRAGNCSRRYNISSSYNCNCKSANLTTIVYT